MFYNNILSIFEVNRIKMKHICNHSNCGIKTCECNNEHVYDIFTCSEDFCVIAQCKVKCVSVTEIRKLKLKKIYEKRG